MEVYASNITVVVPVKKSSTKSAYVNMADIIQLDNILKNGPQEDITEATVVFRYATGKKVSFKISKED